MTAFARLVVLCVVGVVSAQAQYAEDRAPRYIASEPKVAPTPVPILKQINRHNEDGSYTYGYEGADGSFKIETKSTNGEVKGKYGYKDDTGKLRVIEYGANKYGFQPAGEGITVAPPTLVDDTTRPSKNQGGRSQYNQEPDYDYEEPAPTPRQNRPAPQPQYRAPQQQQQQYRPAPQPQQQYRPAPQPQQEYRPAPQPQQQYKPAPSPPPQQYRPAPQSAPTPPKPQFFAGAAPAPAPSQNNFFNPEPQQFQPKQEFRPTPDFNNFGPQPQRFTQTNFQAQPQQRPSSNQQFSMLDQLLKEFALPSNGAAPLHDITFGSY